MTLSNAITNWWSHEVSSGIDHDEVVSRVREDAGWSAHFAFMNVMSAGIAILGLLLSSPAVVIGAMLISPLMGPIIGAGFALATFDTKEIRRAGMALVLGTLIATMFCAGLVLLSPLQTVTSEIAARTRPNLFDLLVALLSGFAGTYAVIRGRHGAIVGVAIATALMPPIAVMGFGLATQNWPVLEGSALLFFTNLMTIAAAAAALARIYGFAADLSPQQTRFQLVLFFGSLALLAIPLGLSLNRIAWEAVTTRTVTDTISDAFGTDARVDNVAVSFHAVPLQVSATVLTPTYHGNAERNLRSSLERIVGQTVDVTIDQVRTSNGALPPSEAASAAAERRATQIATNLAAAAGVSPEDVLIDEHHHLAQSTAVPLPGATLSTYRAIERRLSDAHEGWRVQLIPPLLPLGNVPTGDPKARSDAITTAMWAATRLKLPVIVDGTAEDLNEVIQRASDAGARFQKGRPGGQLTLSWAMPKNEAPKKLR